jgi:hypothetical protein
MAEALLHEHAPDILRVVVERALAGDPHSIKLCLEQILPRRRGQRIELRGFLAEADQDLAKAQLCCPVSSRPRRPWRSQKWSRGWIRSTMSRCDIA